MLWLLKAEFRKLVRPLAGGSRMRYYLRAGTEPEVSGQTSRRSTSSVGCKKSAKCQLMLYLAAKYRARRPDPTDESRTNNQEARPPYLGIGPLTCTYLVAGAGFEPATSGL